MKNDMLDNYKQEARRRIGAIRPRTWAVTIALAITLVFYFLMQATFKDAISIIDLIFLCATAFITHCLYYPDGELYGQKDPKYIANCKEYNKKANAINEQNVYEDLQEFCEYDFQKRTHEYIKREIAIIGITFEELEWFKLKDKKFIKKTNQFEVKSENGTKLLNIIGERKTRLMHLLFRKIPIEKNQPETIMSAVENSHSAKITDNSAKFKKRAYISKILISIIVGLIFSYVGYTIRDGITFAQITLICMFFTTILSTAVTSFGSGELSQKVYKTQFYIDLSLFISAFNEWLMANKGKNLQIASGKN